MVAPVKVSRVPPAAGQHGQAFLLSVLVLFMGVAAIVYNFATRATNDIKKGETTAVALAQARDALIGYAASSSTQPGVLPCPDNDNDGSADAPCGVLGATALGRLPWRTLGMDSLRDGSAECLWYAVSANFKNSGVSGPASINSDSIGTLAVYDGNGTVTHAASEVAAIVFTPGEALPGQNRAPVGATTCGGNVNAAAYLDSYTVGATTYNNATGSGTNSFIAVSTDQTNQFNDRLLPLTTKALFSVVEMRILRELRTALRTYRSTNGYFPGANPYGASTNCFYTTWQGRPPLNIGLGCPLQANWGALPSWFGTNNWQNVTYYAVSPCTVGPAGALQGSVDLLCSALGRLTVGTNPNIDAVVFTAGRAIAALGQARPCANVSACLDDALNRDLNDIFVEPVASATNNDRVLIVWP